MKWRKASLGELVADDRGLVQTGPFGSSLHQSDYSDEGIPVIMPTNITDGRISLDGIARISEHTANRLQRHKLRPRTIVLPRRGEITKRAFIRNDQEGWLCGSGCLKIEVHDTDVVPEFLYYYMAQHDVGQWLEQHAVGSTMLNLSAGIVNDMPVHYPGRAEQLRIADTLTAYDDLMENNRRRMALLEESARLLYREWFVHIRFPGHEKAKLTNGMPKGWERASAFEASQVLSGGTPKTGNPSYWDGEIPFYTPRDAGGNIWATHCERNITDAGLKACNSRLYPKGTVFISARGTVGKLSMAQCPMAMSQSCYALVGRKNLPQTFIFLAMSEGVSGFKQQAAGAVFDAIVVDTFKRIHFLIPTSGLLEIFDKVIQPIFAQVETLTLQTQKLRTARDLLLPRLMSGEIKI